MMLLGLNMFIYCVMILPHFLDFSLIFINIQIR